METKIKSENRLFVSISFILIFYIIFVAFFSVSAGAPLLGSDEYAYFISGKFNDQLEMLYQLDPALQKTSNLLYLSIIRGLTIVFGTQFIPGLRLVNLIGYIVAAWFVYQTVVHTVGLRIAMLGSVAFMLLPTHIFIYTVMPEIKMVLLAAALGFILVRIYPRYGLVGSFLAGVLLGVAMLIKPHALAMILAVFSTITLVCLLRGGNRQFSNLLAHNILTLLSCYLVFMVLWRLLSGVWSIDPSVALSLGSYGQYLHNSSDQILILNKFVNALSYFGVHFIVIFMIFAPVFVWSISQAIHDARIIKTTRNELDFEKSVLAVFALTMITSHIAMAAWFTAGTGAVSDGEAMRLHGRYLSPALVLFPALYFFSIGKLTTLEKKVTTVVSVIVVLLFLAVIVRMYKIYPWDNPLLFAFFNSNNWYGWGFEGSIYNLGIFLILAIVVGLVLSVRYKRLQSQILYVQLFVILLVGCLQTYGWIYSHLRINFDHVTKSKALSMMLGDEQIGKGLVIAEERYGRLSYILFGLANAPKVIERKAGSLISEEDIHGADWLVLGNEYLTKFHDRDYISLGSLKFFPIQPAMIYGQPVHKAMIEPGEQLTIKLAADTTKGVRMIGFNPPEEWGAWSAKNVAEIELPFKLQGHIKLKLFGWSMSENLGTTIHLRVGDVTAALPLTNTGKEVEIDLMITQPSDNVVIESSVFRPTDSHRDLGVAMSSLTFERMLK